MIIFEFSQLVTLLVFSTYLVDVFYFWLKLVLFVQVLKVKVAENGGAIQGTIY